MGKKAPAPPPPPDYSAIAAANEKSAEYSFKLGQEQLAWAKEQYAQDRADNAGIIAAQTGLMEDALQAGREDRERYREVYQGLEDDLVREAEDYASPGRIDRDMGRAQSQVAQAFDAARANATAQLESYGIDPSAARYGALDIGVRAQQAAAAAGAGNNAQLATEAQGRALRSEALNIGKGYPGQIASQYGVALQAGQQAAGNTLAVTNSEAAARGSPVQWQGLGNQALGNWANTLNMSYQNQIAAYNAQNNANRSASSGIGSILGAGLALIPKFEEGGAVPDEMVPDTASPTQGAIPDDVPARLTPGEFVLPKDVVSWMGEEKLQNMIASARKKKQQAAAQPEYGAMPAEQPTYSSPPAMQGALPV